MKKIINLIGKKFHRLNVIKHEGKNNLNKYIWLCLCDCGNRLTVIGENLRNGNTKSCGCLNIDKIKKRSTKHGHASRKNLSRIYKIWKSMIQRCNNKKSTKYPDYGGRGITVCKRWLDSFENFLTDMKEPPTEKHSIDRINNDEGYYKENCRWATNKQQMRNTRNNRLITYNGKTQCLAAWSEELSIDSRIIGERIDKYGWSTEKALTTPIRERGVYHVGSLYKI